MSVPIDTLCLSFMTLCPVFTSAQAWRGKARKARRLAWTSNDCAAYRGSGNEPQSEASDNQVPPASHTLVSHSLLSRVQRRQDPFPPKATARTKWSPPLLPPFPAGAGHTTLTPRMMVGSQHTCPRDGGPGSGVQTEGDWDKPC